MPLKTSDGIGAWIKDFQKSDAPQFKGKSAEKRRDMAIAAYMDAKKGSKMDEQKGNPVAKNLNKFNKPATHKDRKKAMKKGDRKHKGRYEEVSDKKESCGKKHRLPKVKSDFNVRDTVGTRVYEAKDPKRAELYKKYRDASARKDKVAMGKIAKTIAAYNKVNPTMPKNTTVEDKQQTDTSGHTNAAAKKPQNYVDRDGKTKTRMVPAHQDVEKEDVDKAQLKLKHAKEKERLKDKHAREKEMAKESMDPRDFTDKAGHVVVVTKPSGHKSIKHFTHTKPAAQKYADRVNKTNKVGHKATVHKTDGRKIHEEIMNESTYDKTSSAHRIARRTTHGAPGVRPEYHKDGSATVHTGPSGPRSSTDGVNHHLRDIGAEHGHSTKELGKKHVTKHDGHTHTVTTKDGHSHQIHIKAHGTNEAVDRGFGSRMKAADAAANSYSKTKRKPENDTIRAIRAKHAAKKTVKEETVELDEATSAKLRAKMKELAGGQLPRSSVELRKLKAKAQDALRNDRAAKKAAPAQKTTTKTSKGKTHTGSSDPADRNIIMQLRKAQDVGGKHDIRVSPTGKTVRLPKDKIDALLKRHDSISKPRDKRMFNVQLTKALRKIAK